MHLIFLYGESTGKFEKLHTYTMCWGQIILSVRSLPTCLMSTCVSNIFKCGHLVLLVLTPVASCHKKSNQESQREEINLLHLSSQEWVNASIATGLLWKRLSASWKMLNGTETGSQPQLQLHKLLPKTADPNLILNWQKIKRIAQTWEKKNFVPKYLLKEKWGKAVN